MLLANNVFHQEEIKHEHMLTSNKCGEFAIEIFLANIIIVERKNI